MRKLHIIPIVHSRQDLGSLDGPIAVFKSQMLTESAFRSSRSAVEVFWQELKRGIESWQIDFTQVMLFQDALPYTGQSQKTIEHQIVRELAAKGSPNHQLLAWLIDHGAILNGTESTELLLKEYEAVRRALAAGFRDDDEDNEDQMTQTSLLAERDQFIAERIANTLQTGQTGILFIGMLHRVENYLDSGIEVAYPFGRPREKMQA